MRKTFCLMIIITLLCCNIVFASVVSDNDGSSFITKAEFDSLKNGFQGQIDTYTKGIDGKIDSAIASYLSGIISETMNRKTALFSVFPQTTIKSLKNADIAWSEDRQGWNNVFSYFGCYNLSPASGTTTYRPYFKMGRLSTSLSPVAGKRGLYKDITVSGSKKYQWSGYSINYKQTNDASWVFQQFLVDLGYLVSGQYFKGYEYEDANLTYDKRTIMDATKFCFWLTDANNFPPQKTNRCIINSSYSYTLQNEYDYIFSDPTVASSTAGALRKQDDNEYWSYSEGTYTQKNIFDSATLDSAHDFYSHMSGGGTSKQSITKQDMPTGGTAPRSMPYNAKGQLISAPLRAEKSNVTWADIFHKDSNRYDYRDTTGEKILQYYSMIGGIPLLAVEKDKVYEWEPYFSETSNIRLWIKYNPFTGTGVPGSDVINIYPTKEDAKSKNPTTQSQYLTVTNGHKKMFFNATQNGIVFVKWRLESDSAGGGSLKVNESKEILEYSE